MPVSTLLATDEDVAVRASGDFPILCPKDQKFAYGTDGVFDAGDRWTLTSATVPFSTYGVADGHVAQLAKSGVFSPPLEMFVVTSSTTGAITLRRKGMTDATGQPPGPAAGTTGVTFTVATLHPQIEDASYDLYRRFGIDDAIPGRTAASLYDVREARQACVLTVLKNQYLAMARQAGESSDDFAAKAKRIDGELSDLLARLAIHWQGVSGWGTSPEPATTRFGTRLSR